MAKHHAGHKEKSHHAKHESHHDGHHMHHAGHSHKNTSMGGHGMGNTGADYVHIHDRSDPRPPPGAHNSYEKVREKIDHHDHMSLSHHPYSREKMMNK